MTPRTARRILFVLFVATLPLPLLIFQATLAPPLRYWIFALASSALVLREGAGGAVPLIVAMFWAHAAVYTAACWLLAWALARALSRMPPAWLRITVWSAVVLALLAALALPVYRTPMGAAPVSSLIGALT